MPSSPPFSLATPPTTDPGPILRFRDRQYGAELIAAGLMHLDFFTWLGENADVTTDEIIAHFGFVARPADVFLTLCRASGFIETDAEDHTRLTAMGREHLVAGSPWYLGPYFAPIKDTQIVVDFLNILRTGKPANWQARDDHDDWHESMLDPVFAQSFTELMNCRGMSFGQALAKQLDLGERQRLLDVGGGSGIYSTTMAAVHPQLTAVVFEQPPVDTITHQEIEKHGLSDRVEVVSGDMFTDPWPDDADILLLSNVLHDWDFPQVRALLEKAAATLPTGGLLVIHDAFIADDKHGPLPVAEYSALLMNITQGKCYSAKEYGDVLREVGFEVGPYVATTADRGYMTAVKSAS